MVALTENLPQAMVQFLLENGSFKDFKSPAIWMLMAKRQVVPGNHTWNALKTRFFKRILPRLSSFGLTEKELHQLRGEVQERRKSRRDSRS